MMFSSTLFVKQCLVCSCVFSTGHGEATPVTGVWEQVGGGIRPCGAQASYAGG